MHKIKQAIAEMNATIGFYDDESIGKLAAETASVDEESASFSSSESSRLQGEHIDPAPAILPRSLSEFYPSPQNLREEDRQLFLNKLIAAGDWNAVALESSMYQSEPSTVSSNTTMSDSSSQN